MTTRALVSSVLPLTLLESGADDLAYAELYDDPPDLAPLPEEEALIAKSVAKRRNEFITVRH
ncbi:MAG: 4'-phosphopantetheinyl transferase, partial [Mycobacterium sp.]